MSASPLCHYVNGFSKTVEAIRLLRQRGVDVKINGSVTKCNYQDMMKIYEIGQEMKVPVHMDTYMLPGLRERHMPFELQSRLLPENAAAAYVYMHEKEMEPEVFRQYAYSVIEKVGQENVSYSDQVTCLVGNCSFAISWDGKMRPCITFEKPAVSVFDL